MVPSRPLMWWRKPCLATSSVIQRTFIYLIQDSFRNWKKEWQHGNEKREENRSLILKSRAVATSSIFRFFLNREEHERIGDIIKKYGHFLKVYNYMNFFSFYLVFPLSGFFHLTLSSLKEHCTELFFFLFVAVVLVVLFALTWSKTSPKRLTQCSFITQERH